MRRSIHPFVNDLGLTQLLETLANYKSEISADHCQKTLDSVVENAIDTVNNKIIDLLQVVANKVRSPFAPFPANDISNSTTMFVFSSVDVTGNKQISDRRR